MAQPQLHLPTSYGGLVRYNEEYGSMFKLTPIHVVVFIITIIVFVTMMKILWPISG